MNKKKKNIFLKLIGMLFVFYLIIYIVNLSGYYERLIRDRVSITDKGIKNFEEKVKNGEEIDITNFLNNEKKDYSNKVTKVGEYLTYSVDNVVTNGIGVIKNIINTLF